MKLASNTLLKTLRRKYLGGALLAATCATSGWASVPWTQTSDCNSLIAINKQPTVVDEGGTRTCGVGLVIFGVGGSIWGEKCPKIQHKTPAHQVCEIVQLPIPDIFHCQKEQNLPVYTRENSCGGAVIPYIEVGVPTTCNYGEWKENGDVEDFETVPCEA